MLRASLTAVALATLIGCASPEVAPMKEPLQVYAAGSLREVLTEIARDHEMRTGQKIALTFGASGLLRERIEKGEGAMVFASADTQHPQRLAAAGGWAPHTVFVRNSLCALTQANVNATPQTLLATMLNPAVKLGTSTPKADPSGDYAWELFRKADQVRAGAYAALDAKALKLTGGPDSPKPPGGQGTYAWVMDQGQADVFLTYCTNAVASQKEVPRLKVVQVPVELQVGASYGLTVRQGAPAQAEAFAKALLAPPAQATFARYGFGKP
jgi:ABC-type molybdate transport system substrate-binding protein